MANWQNNMNVLVCGPNGKVVHIFKQTNLSHFYQ